MKCLTPKEIKKVGPNGPTFLLVPCGSCYACQTNRRNEWDLRLRIENMSGSKSYFVTLTYSDEFLPADCKVNKKHIQNFIQTLRNNYKDTKFRYYAIGEYGEKFGRPHYHLLMFLDGKDIDFIHAVYSFWPYGFVDVGSVEDASIHYVTKWHVNPKHQLGKEMHGFSLMSKGIGQGLLTSLTLDNIHASHNINGTWLPVSRYYRKKLGFKVENVESMQEYLQRKYNLKTNEQIVAKYEAILKQYEKLQQQQRSKLF